MTLMENPLLIEAKRFGRRFFGASRAGSLNRIYIGLTVLVYVLLLGLTLAYGRDIESQTIIHLQTGILCMMVPSITHGTIAGERERRTWDLLICSPISKTQIVLGKYISAILVILSVALAMLPLVLIAYALQVNEARSPWTAELVSICFSCCFAALAIFISSRMNRSLAAQATIYGVLFLWMLVYPILVASAGVDASLFLWNNPFFVINQSFDTSHYVSESGFGYFYSSPIYGPIFQFAMYAGMALLFVYLAIIGIGGKGLVLQRRDVRAAR